MTVTMQLVKFTSLYSTNNTEWCATLPGSTGIVGTVGQSYMGFAQLALASKRPPHLKAMSVVSGFCWLWDNCTYRQGVLEVVKLQYYCREIKNKDFFVKYYNMLARDYLRKKGKPEEADALFGHFSKVLQENMGKKFSRHFLVLIFF